MLSDEAKRTIGLWRRGLLRLKPFMPASIRNWLANMWLEQGLSHAAKSAALFHAARAMDPTVAADPDDAV